MRIKTALSALFLALLFCTSQSLGAREIFERGIASWYAGEFQGRLTANGEIFDTHSISAAHKSLPFGTIVRVTNEKNGLSLEVRINDRGPYVEGRIIDLSMAAAAELDMVEDGIAPVRLELVYTPKVPESAYQRTEDARELQIQVGAFGSVRTAYEIYMRILEVGLDPYAQLLDSGIIRVGATWVDPDDSERTIELLQQAGFEELLVRPLL